MVFFNNKNKEIIAKKYTFTLPRNIVLSIVHGLRLRTVFLYFVDFPAVSKQLFYTCGTQADLHVELDGVHAEDLVADV